eukprot:6299636-Prymnesium_polylepis.1
MQICYRGALSERVNRASVRVGAGLRHAVGGADSVGFLLEALPGLSVPSLNRDEEARRVWSEPRLRYHAGCVASGDAGRDRQRRGRQYGGDARGHLYVRSGAGGADRGGQ